MSITIANPSDEKGLTLARELYESLLIDTGLNAMEIIKEIYFLGFMDGIEAGVITYHQLKAIGTK
jgi:hypothetical protein